MSTTDERAFAIEDGMLYSFPVNYVGSIIVNDSIRTQDLSGKAVVCREAIRRCSKLAGVSDESAKKKHKVKKIAKKMLNDNAIKLIQPNQNLPWVKLTMSTEGIICQSIKTGKILSRHLIEEISVALAFVASDDDQFHDYVTFTTKKKGQRFLHVFDCSQFANEVIGTFGQIFGARRIKRSTDDASSSSEDEQQETILPGDRTYRYEDDDCVFGFEEEPTETSDEPIYESFGGDALCADTTVDDWGQFDGGYASLPVNKSTKQGVTLNGYQTLLPAHMTSGVKVLAHSYLDVCPEPDNRAVVG